jgi:hypothetical protein
MGTPLGEGNGFPGKEMHRVDGDTGRVVCRDAFLFHVGRGQANRDSC